MAIRRSSFYYLAFLAFLRFSVGSTPDPDNPGKIICYDAGDNAYSNNTQCPGSNICCQTTDQCLSERLCAAKGQLVVPACTVYPWVDCSNICQYATGTGLLPRAFQCSDGSFCCDDDPSCCGLNEGIVLNTLGGIVSTDGGLTSTTSSTTTSTTTTSTVTSTTAISTTTTSSSPASTSSTLATATGSTESSPTSENSSGGLSSGALAGIVIGAIAIFAIIIGLIVVIWLQHKRRSDMQKAVLNRPTETYAGEIDHRPAAPGYQSYQSYQYSQPGNGTMGDKPRYVFEAPDNTTPNRGVYEMGNRQ